MAGEPAAAESRLRSDYDALTAMDERYFRPIIAALLAKSLYELNRLEEAADLAAFDRGDREPRRRRGPGRSRARCGRGSSPPTAPRTRRAPSRSRPSSSSPRPTRPFSAPTRSIDVAEALAGSADERAALLEEARALYEQKQHLLGLARVEAELAARTPVG